MKKIWGENNEKERENNMSLVIVAIDLPKVPKTKTNPKLYTK